MKANKWQLANLKRKKPRILGQKEIFELFVKDKYPGDKYNKTWPWDNEVIYGLEPLDPAYSKVVDDHFWEMQ